MGDVATVVGWLLPLYSQTDEAFAAGSSGKGDLDHASGFGCGDGSFGGGRVAVQSVRPVASKGGLGVFCRGVGECERGSGLGVRGVESIRLGWIELMCLI
jgi:hypothetical protein